MQCASQVLGVLLNNSGRRSGLILLPEFTYKKGQLYLQEVAVLQLLSGANLNIDRTFGVCFELGTQTTNLQGTDCMWSPHRGP